MSVKKYYIKERHNPQTGIYYVPMGQLTKAEAKKHENSLYGYNVMFDYNTKDEYEKAIHELKSERERVF